MCCKVLSYENINNRCYCPAVAVALTDNCCINYSNKCCHDRCDYHINHSNQSNQSNQCNHINNNNQHNLNNNIKSNIDGAAAVSGLMEKYYNSIYNTGWCSISTQNMYHKDATIFYNNNMFSSPYDLLNYLSSNYIKRAEYDIRQVSWNIDIGDPNKLMINVSGLLKYINFMGEYSDIHTFSDSFIVYDLDGTLQIVNHTFHSFR